jgi:hypothetical protein
MISAGTTEDDLNLMFELHGGITSIVMARDDRDLSTKCALITYSKMEEAVNAVVALNGTVKLPGCLHAMEVRIAGVSDQRFIRTTEGAAALNMSTTVPSFFSITPKKPGGSLRDGTAGPIGSNRGGKNRRRSDSSNNPSSSSTQRSSNRKSKRSSKSAKPPGPKHILQRGGHEDWMMQQSHFARFGATSPSPYGSYGGPMPMSPMTPNGYVMTPASPAPACITWSVLGFQPPMGSYYTPQFAYDNAYMSDASSMLPDDASSIGAESIDYQSDTAHVAVAKHGAASYSTSDDLTNDYSDPPLSGEKVKLVSQTNRRRSPEIDERHFATPM